MGGGRLTLSLFCWVGVGVGIPVTKAKNIILYITRHYKAGTVWCNCWMVRDLRMPFGGMKGSGVGRESQNDSREFFTEAKTICIKMD